MGSILKYLKDAAYLKAFKASYARPFVRLISSLYLSYKWSCLSQFKRGVSSQPIKKRGYLRKKARSKLCKQQIPIKFKLESKSNLNRAETP